MNIRPRFWRIMHGITMIGSNCLQFLYLSEKNNEVKKKLTLTDTDALSVRLH